VEGSSGLSSESRKSGYWKGVAARLGSIGKTALNAAAPVAINLGVSALISKACDEIELRLKKMYKKTAINSSISFCINLAAMLCLGFKPFGEKPSVVVSVVLFAGATIFFFVRLALGIKSYGRQVFEVSKNIFKTKSIHKGIEAYVLNNFLLISLAYAGIDLGSVYVPALRDVPRIPQLVDFFVKHFWKRFALYAGIVASYTISIYWILKPSLLQRFF
jgi:hypothetical protein